MSKCVIKVVDSYGIQHSTAVEAESLYEAVAKALQAFKHAHIYLKDDERIEVDQQFIVTHTLTIGRIIKWLRKNSTDIDERILKEKIRNILDRQL